MTAEARTCARCNAPFQPPEHEYGHKRLYCSEPCRRRAAAARKRGRKLTDRRLCECGCGEMVLNRYVRGHNSHERRKPPPPLIRRESLEAHFQRFVGEPDENGCWPWLGSTSNRATVFSDSRIPTKTHVTGAHRVALFIYRGKWPPALVAIRRKCNNKMCVNPRHLKVGTKKRKKASGLIVLTPGERFGKLTVISRAENSKRGEARWLCQCECGAQTTTPGINLMNGQQECRHCPKHEDLSGQRFSRLVALAPKRGEDGIFRWECQCDCGTRVDIRRESLTSGNTRSCGCLKRELLATPHLPGERFGRLTIIGSGDTPMTWLCRCDCGTELIVEGRRLRKDRVKSCGCIEKEIEQERIETRAQRARELLEQRQERANLRAGKREERLSVRRDEIVERTERRRLAQLSKRLEREEVTACLLCDAPIIYAGRGRPRKYCPECAPSAYLNKTTLIIAPPRDRDLVEVLIDRTREAGMVDIEGAARVLGITPSAVKRLANEGHLQHSGRGSQMRFEVAWLGERRAQLEQDRLLV